ncbi:MAG: hypothetical protein ACT6RL_05010 [Neoaquamicrobium sediminum]|uniref:hypothetical protein n=1 Tax=Neoaquamicrobium sediminum TaxID=1849104 RepID=UPI0040363991
MSIKLDRPVRVSRFKIGLELFQNTVRGKPRLHRKRIVRRRFPAGSRTSRFRVNDDARPRDTKPAIGRTGPFQSRRTARGEFFDQPRQAFQYGGLSRNRVVEVGEFRPNIADPAGKAFRDFCGIAGRQFDRHNLNRRHWRRGFFPTRLPEVRRAFAHRLNDHVYAFRPNRPQVVQEPKAVFGDGLRPSRFRDDFQRFGLRPVEAFPRAPHLRFHAEDVRFARCAFALGVHGATVVRARRLEAVAGLLIRAKS